MNYRDAKANHSCETERASTEERGFFQGSLKVSVILAGLFAVGYLLSWLIGG